jgi:3-phenylpropionate/trans-cinnamate dioxygenase ferredoxin reductase component
VPADLVVVGLGVLPNAELAGAAGIAVDDGILVDQQLRTNMPGVFDSASKSIAINEALT